MEIKVTEEPIKIRIMNSNNEKIHEINEKFSVIQQALILKKIVEEEIEYQNTLAKVEPDDEWYIKVDLLESLLQKSKEFVL